MAFTANQIKFVRTIEGYMKENADFLNTAMDDNEHLDGKTVKLPTAGSLPATRRNTTTYPVDAVEREDFLSEYDISEYAKGPVLLKKFNIDTVSYPILKSVTEDMMSEMMDDIKDGILYDWCPPKTVTTNIARTTGDDRDCLQGFNMTGTRKAFTKEDAIYAEEFMNRNRVPARDRYVIIPPNFQSDLLNIEGYTPLTPRELIINNANAPEDYTFIGYLLSFKVIMHTRGLLFDPGTGVPVKQSITLGTIDDIEADWFVGALFYQKTRVRKAAGSIGNGGIDLIINPRMAEYDGGTLITTTIHAGGSPSKSNYHGILAMVEGV